MGHFETFRALPIDCPSHAAAVAALDGKGRYLDAECSYTDMCEPTVRATLPGRLEVYLSVDDAIDAVYRQQGSGAALAYDFSNANTETLTLKVKDRDAAEGRDAVVRALRAEVKRKNAAQKAKRYRLDLRSVAWETSGATISGGRTDGTATTVYDVRVTDEYRELHQSSHPTQAAARAAAEAVLAQHPDRFLDAEVSARTFRLADDGQEVPFVRLSSRPRGVVATATVSVIDRESPALLVLVGDCHH